MKRFFSTAMIVAVAAMSFSSCQKEVAISEEPSSFSTVLHITAVAPEAVKSVFGDKTDGAYPTKWTTEKKVRFIANDTRDTKNEITPTLADGGASATFEPEFSSLATTGTIYAFSPVGNYSSTPKIPGFTSFINGKDQIYLSIPSEQTPLASSVDESAQVLFASKEYTNSNPSISMTFKHVVAYGKMAITNFAGTIKSVELQFPVDVTGLSCKYSYKTDVLANLDGKSITLDPANVVDNVFWFALAPTTGNTGEMKVIITDNNDDTYTKTIDLETKALPFTKGHVSSFSVNFSGIEKDAKETSFTWDLTKASYKTSTEMLVTWKNAFATMTNAKGSSAQNANAYLGGTKSNTRTYNGQTLTIAPETGCEITRVIITATTKSYADPINSNWTNATVSQDVAVLTITPTDGTKSFYVTSTGTTRLTSVQVFYTFVATKTLTSISLSGTYPTEFNTGDEFSHVGIIVTATYDDSSQKVVTEDAEFSGYDMSTPGAQTVTVSYTEVTTTKTASYGITVTAVPQILADDIVDAPAVGGKDLEHSYTAKNFTDDVEVASVSGQVTEAIAMEGEIVYTLAPNYTTGEKDGTIVLQSASNHEVTKTINVSQKSSSLSVSGTEITIPYNATSATFTITSREFGWNLDVTPASGMNLTTDKSSEESNASAQTVTISSTTEASTSEVLTLGTIVVYRNGNTSDSQKKTITVKKGAAPAAGSKYFVKTSSISAGQYLFVYAGKAGSSIVSGGLTLSDITITDDKILKDETTLSYAITIAEVESGKYSLKLGDKYLGYGSSGTDIKTSDTVSSNNYQWTITVLSDGSIEFINVGKTSRFIGVNNASTPTQFKAYSTSNGPSIYPCPTLYKLED